MLSTCLPLCLCRIGKNSSPLPNLHRQKQRVAVVVCRSFRAAFRVGHDPTAKLDDIDPRVWLADGPARPPDACTNYSLGMVLRVRPSRSLMAVSHPPNVS
jgi:hypothetical protein